MTDMLSEMGLDELLDIFSSVKQDMDPTDLKLMKIKHRTKELKEIAKADAEYLKAIFEHLEKQKSGPSAPLENAVSTGNSALTPNAVSVAAPTDATDKHPISIRTARITQSVFFIKTSSLIFM